MTCALCHRQFENGDPLRVAEQMRLDLLDDETR
jgi:hypothetical protein